MWYMCVHVNKDFINSDWKPPYWNIIDSVKYMSWKQNWWNYFRRVATQGGRRSKSSAPHVNPWCFVVAENTPKLHRSRMACCCRANAHVPVVGIAIKNVRWPVAPQSAHVSEWPGGRHRHQSGVSTRYGNFVNWCTFSALHLAANI